MSTSVIIPGPVIDASGNATYTGTLISAAMGTAALPVFAFTADGGISGMWLAAGNNLAFSSHGILAFYLDSAGNLNTSGNSIFAGLVRGTTVQPGGASGAVIRSGSASPSGSVTGGNGDIYLATGGASGARLWVCAGGTTWTAVAGV